MNETTCFRCGDERRSCCDALTQKTRRQIIRANPKATAARLYFLARERWAA